LQPRFLEHADVFFDVGVLSVELLGSVLVIPETRFRYFVFEDGKTLTIVTDREIYLGLAESSLQLADVLGEVTHW
jgi:hypothetical protein